MGWTFAYYDKLWLGPGLQPCLGTVSLGYLGKVVESQALARRGRRAAQGQGQEGKAGLDLVPAQTILGP
eukprot:4250612-Prorocentrum_lima.AAC.1